MNIKKLFAKRMLVAEDLRLPVSRQFMYSTFAVRGRYDQRAHLVGFICEGTPGTGFFPRNTESHSYSRFVSECRKKTKQSLLTFLLRKDPNFTREFNRAEAAINATSDDNVKQILATYQNVIQLAKEEELLQRIVRAIKDKMGHKPNKTYVSILSHYKSSIATLERDVKSVQKNYSTMLSADETKSKAWEQVVEAFHLLVDSRRVWSVCNSPEGQSYEQVFFDMGIFDYIQSPGDTPVMRDHRGLHYYLYPDGMIAARSTVDFDFYKWSDIEMTFNVVDINTLAVRPQFNSHRHHKHHHKSGSDALSTLYGTTRSQVVGEIKIPKLDLCFFVNHTGPADDFVKAINNWKNL